MKNKFIIIFIISFGFSLRIWNLTNLPAGFTADEASHGYDAYSLIKTGKDQWGQPWPIAFRSFGDFKLPVYTYITIPFVIINGLNEFSVRLPAAILGTLAILATYLFTKELLNLLDQAPKSIVKGQWLTVTIMSSLLLAISPWHLQLSRSAVEANLTSFFVPLALWTWLKGFKNNHKKSKWIPSLSRMTNGWWILTAILLGINLYTYHAARAFTLLLILLISLITWKEVENKNNSIFSYLIHNPINSITSLINKQNSGLQLIKQNILPITIFIVFLIPMGISLVSGGSSRGLDVAVFNPTDNWQALSNLRHEAVIHGMPDFIARLITNKLTYSIQKISYNYLTYLSPYFLFIQGPGEATYGMLPGRGVLHWFELPLILLTIIYFIKKPIKPLTFLITLLLLAPIPASLSKGNGLAANRATPMLPFIHILSAFGLLIIIDHLNKLNPLLRRFTYLFICSSIIIFFGLFLKDYIIHAPKIQAQAMSYGWREAVLRINQLANPYDHIIISRKFNSPHIFPMFYTPIDPAHLQQISPNWLEYQKQNLNFIDQLGQYQLDKFSFLEIQTEHLHQPNTLIVARPEDFLTPKPTILEINRPAYPQPTPAIIFLDTSDQD